MKNTKRFAYHSRDLASRSYPNNVANNNTTVLKLQRPKVYNPELSAIEEFILAGTHSRPALLFVMSIVDTVMHADATEGSVLTETEYSRYRL